jgi:hypothetical protein
VRSRVFSDGVVSEVIDLWLPRDLQVDVTIEARGLRATERIGTFDKDKTCITTLKLHY